MSTRGNRCDRYVVDGTKTAMGRQDEGFDYHTMFHYPSPPSWSFWELDYNIHLNGYISGVRSVPSIELKYESFDNNLKIHKFDIMSGLIRLATASEQARTIAEGQKVVDKFEKDSKKIVQRFKGECHGHLRRVDGKLGVVMWVDRARSSDLWSESPGPCSRYKVEVNYPIENKWHSWTDEKDKKFQRFPQEQDGFRWPPKVSGVEIAGTFIEIPIEPAGDIEYALPKEPKQSAASWKAEQQNKYVSCLAVQNRSEYPRFLDIPCGICTNPYKPEIELMLRLSESELVCWKHHRTMPKVYPWFVHWPSIALSFKTDSLELAYHKAHCMDGQPWKLRESRKDPSWTSPYYDDLAALIDVNIIEFSAVWDHRYKLRRYWSGKIHTKKADMKCRCLDCKKAQLIGDNTWTNTPKINKSCVKCNSIRLSWIDSNHSGGKPWTRLKEHYKRIIIFDEEITYLHKERSWPVHLSIKFVEPTQRFVGRGSMPFENIPQPSDDDEGLDSIWNYAYEKQIDGFNPYSSSWTKDFKETHTHQPRVKQELQSSKVDRRLKQCLLVNDPTLISTPLLSDDEWLVRIARLQREYNKVLLHQMNLASYEPITVDQVADSLDRITEREARKIIGNEEHGICETTRRDGYIGKLWWGLDRLIKKASDPITEKYFPECFVYFGRERFNLYQTNDRDRYRWREITRQSFPNPEDPDSERNMKIHQTWLARRLHKPPAVQCKIEVGGMTFLTRNEMVSFQVVDGLEVLLLAVAVKLGYGRCPGTKQICPHAPETFISRFERSKTLFLP